MSMTTTIVVAVVALLVAAPLASATVVSGATAQSNALQTDVTAPTAATDPGNDLGPGLQTASIPERTVDARSSLDVRSSLDARSSLIADANATDREPPGDEPVLLVHGFADTGYTPWWEAMTDNLTNTGYEHGEVFVLNLGAIPGSTVDSPEDYGAAVCDALDTVKDRTGASEVDVVAHSMGGLDSRHCIEKQGGAEDVDDLVTLGTPHQGTYVAYLAYITPGGRDMVPGSEFLTDLNDGQLARGVEYTAVWSDWDELINPDEYAKLPTEERRSVATARNRYVDDSFHAQLVWDDDVFDAWIEHLD